MTDYIYGKNSFREALRNKRISKAYVLNNDFIGELDKNGIPYKYVDRKFLDKLTKNGNHQGCVGEAYPFKFSNIESMFKEKNGLIVMLDGIQDAQNLGAIIRTAECAGVDGLIYKRHDSVKINETVAKVASGALEYLKIAEVDNLTNTIKYLKKNNYWVVCSAVDGKTLYDETKYDMNTLLVIGSEGKGISRLVKENADFLIKLPMYGKINSLNASAATSVLIYNILSSRKKST